MEIVKGSSLILFSTKLTKNLIKQEAEKGIKKQEGKARKSKKKKRKQDTVKERRYTEEHCFILITSKLIMNDIIGTEPIYNQHQIKEIA